jgi:hypothetical protein
MKTRGYEVSKPNGIDSHYYNKILALRRAYYVCKEEKCWTRVDSLKTGEAIARYKYLSAINGAILEAK